MLSQMCLLHGIARYGMYESMLCATSCVLPWNFASGRATARPIAGWSVQERHKSQCLPGVQGECSRDGFQSVIYLCPFQRIPQRSCAERTPWTRWTTKLDWCAKVTSPTPLDLEHSLASPVCGLGTLSKIRWKKLFGALYFESAYKSSMETPLLFGTGLFRFHRRTFSSLLNQHLPHDYVNLFPQ